MKERRTPRKSGRLAGQLLLAHPALRDPNFRRTVILLSAHDADGAMGVVLNRALDRQLGELNPSFALGPLAGVPVYAGGPVEPEVGKRARVAESATSGSSSGAPSGMGAGASHARASSSTRARSGGVAR